MNRTNISMTANKQTGYLEIILGGMYAGKTSRIVEIYKQCIFCNISVITINHEIDNRYDSEMLSTHDKIKIPCIKTDSLMKLYSHYLDTELSLEDCTDVLRVDDIRFKIASSDVILINEGQFFPDLLEFIEILLKNHKKIYVCGLDGDFERKKFGQMLDLIPLCDKVTKLTSLCSICKNGTPGIFSKRIGNEKEQTIVGSINYIPVCRNCYDK